MSRCVICTVGTSLLTNRDDRPWAGWNPRKTDPLPDPNEVDVWLRQAKLAAASAETNTLSRLDLDESDELVLLHSDTPEGRFCAKRLKSFFAPELRSVELEKIGSLGYGSFHFTTGLKALVDIVIRCVHKARVRGREPLFCATGGFKAEIAFLNLLGALLGIEVIYIHELHRELVRLPRLPLTWDAEFVTRHKDFFRWIDEKPRPSREVESWLKGRPELRSLVEDGDDGCTYLTAAGDLFFKAARERISTGPRAVWPEVDPRLPSQKNRVSATEHHRPEGWERFVDRLCAIDCVRLVRYDRAASGGSKVKIIDAQNGILGIHYGEPGKELPLRVETTARDDVQCKLVAAYLRGLK